MVVVKDMFKLDIAQKFSLRAGEAGLTNHVSWIYVCQENEISPWVQGHEILILYGSGLHCDEESLIKIVAACAQCEIAALLVLTGNFIESIPEKMIEEADRHSIPLIELSYMIPISQITKEIANLIILQNRLVKSNPGEVLRSMLSGYEACSEEGKDKLIGSGYLWKEKNIIFMVQMENSETVNQIKSIIGNLVYALIGTKTFYVQSNYVIGLAGGNDSEFKKVLLGNCETLVKELQNKYSLDCCMGIGINAAEVGRLQNSYAMAVRALKAREFLVNGQKVVCFDEIPGLLQIIYDMNQMQVPGRLVQNLIGKLIAYDRRKGTDLIETLKVYLSSNCNAKLTAEKMFVHRNTLSYRLRLIESLTGRNLSLTSDCFEFMTALYCYQFILWADH